MIAIGGTLGYIFLGLIWLLAVMGIVFEFISLEKFPKLSIFLYLFLGWLAVFIIYPLYHAVAVGGLILLLAGGLTYSIGTIFYRMKHNKWMHIIWHLFVVGGSVFMFLSILLYI